MNWDGVHAERYAQVNTTSTTSERCGNQGSDQDCRD